MTSTDIEVRRGGQRLPGSVLYKGHVPLFVFEAPLTEGEYTFDTAKPCVPAFSFRVAPTDAIFPQDTGRLAVTESTAPPQSFRECNRATDNASVRLVPSSDLTPWVAVGLVELTFASTVGGEETSVVTLAEALGGVQVDRDYGRQDVDVRARLLTISPPTPAPAVAISFPCGDDDASTCCFARVAATPPPALQTPVTAFSLAALLGFVGWRRRTARAARASQR